MHNSKDSLEKLFATQRALEPIMEIQRKHQHLFQWAGINAGVLAQASMAAAISAPYIPIQKNLSLTLERVSAHLATINSVNIQAMTASLNILSKGWAQQAQLISFDPFISALRESFSATNNAYFADVTHRWENLNAKISTMNLDDEAFATPSISLQENVADNVAGIIEQTVPDEIEGKESWLQKIRGKISVSDFLTILFFLLQLLIDIHEQKAEDIRQQAMEQNMQAIVQESQELRNQLEENEQSQKELLHSIQRLTEIVEVLVEEEASVTSHNEQ